MAERGDGRARRRRTSADVQWAKVHGRHLSIPIEWLDKRRHDHVALGADTGCKGATSNGNDCSQCEYCLHRRIYLCEARDVRGCMCGLEGKVRERLHRCVDQGDEPRSLRDRLISKSLKQMRAAF